MTLLIPYWLTLQTCKTGCVQQLTVVLYRAVQTCMYLVCPMYDALLHQPLSRVSGYTFVLREDSFFAMLPTPEANLLKLFGAGQARSPKSRFCSKLKQPVPSSTTRPTTSRDAGEVRSSVVPFIVASVRKCAAVSKLIFRKVEVLLSMPILLQAR